MSQKIFIQTSTQKRCAADNGLPKGYPDPATLTNIRLNSKAVEGYNECMNTIKVKDKGYKSSLLKSELATWLLIGGLAAVVFFTYKEVVKD
jgi:hypothetical protein